MTNLELIKVLGFIKSCYPKFEYPYGDDSKDSQFEEAWMMFLAGSKYETVMLLVKEYVPKHPTWPPTVGEIINELQRVAKPESERLTADEAWLQVTDVAQSNFYWAHAQRLEDAFPKNIRRAVRAVGGLSYLAGTSMSDPFPRKNFMEAFNDINERIETEPSPQLNAAVKGAQLGSVKLGDMLGIGPDELPGVNGTKEE